MQYIQGLFQARLGAADYALVTSSSRYHGSLDAWVVHMSAAKFKPLTNISCVGLRLVQHFLFHDCELFLLVYCITV
jgi:hypothetical protein